MIDEKFLTEREYNVLKLLTKGLKNEEISNELNISVHTTKAHLESIYDKLNVTNRVQAAIKSLQIGIFNIEEILKN